VRAVRGLGGGLERRSRGGRGMIARIFVFVEIPQQIGCGISTIMGRAAGLSRQSGQNRHVRTAAEAGAPEPEGGERLSKRHCRIGAIAKLPHGRPRHLTIEITVDL